jgi:hypothetical protein
MRRFAVAAVILALAASAYAAPDKVKAPQFLLSAGIVGFSAADTAITIYGTRRLGLVEANPMMRPFLENRRYAALWAVQGAAVAGILAGCHFLVHHDEKPVRIVGYALLVAANVGRAYCVFHNLSLHRKVRRTI